MPALRLPLRRCGERGAATEAYREHLDAFPDDVAALESLAAVLMPTFAADGDPSAQRAVGTAVGRNPVSFLIPCHRALRKSGGLGGYHWGLPRKRAILGWEAGISSR